MSLLWQEDIDITENRKQIAFDIDTNVAESILGNNYRNIYNKIKYFLVNNNFKNIQGSVYQSKERISTTRVMYLVDMLVSTYPYLEKCIRDINVTEILEISNLNHLLSYDGTPGRYEGMYRNRYEEELER